MGEAKLHNSQRDRAQWNLSVEWKEMLERQTAFKQAGLEMGRDTSSCIDGDNGDLVCSGMQVTLLTVDMAA